jgi:hypothetical protein
MVAPEESTMSKPNPLTARAGTSRRFTVTKERKGWLRHVATLHDCADSGFDGLAFKGFTAHGASLAAWNHAARIVEHEGTFDARGYSTI